MLVVTGALLVLVTWVFCAVVLVLLGRPLASWMTAGSSSAAITRRAVWWGLLIVALLVSGANLWVPVGSGAMAALIGLLAGACAIWAARHWRAARRAAHRNQPAQRIDPEHRAPWSGAAKALAVAAGLAVVTLAFSALGPLTNTDSGLYHLGAIRYTADFTAITGLSNLYGPLGYSTAEFPLAALLGNGPWGDEGARLLNGLLLSLVLLDLVLRARRGPLSAGFFVELVGATVLVVPMVALADFWIVSPTQDGAVFALTVVATGYLADAVSRRREFLADAGALGALLIVLVMIRPTMAFFAVAAVVVLSVRGWHLRHETPRRRAITTSGLLVGAAVIAAAVTTARGYRLSGWLLYPLSVLPFDVPWRAGDPTELREATLGYHRNPEDIWGSINGWDWLGPWFARLPGQWETWVLAALLLATVLVVVLKPPGTSLRWRGLVVCVIPSIVATVAWFAVSPPSYRFGWGPVLTLGSIPLGWMLWRTSRAATPGKSPWPRLALGGASTLIVVAAVVTLVGRTEWSTMTDEHRWALGPVGLAYATTPLPEVEVEQRALNSGLTLVTPREGEQCWGVFPLCTPRVNADLQPIGATFVDGLLP